MIQNQETQILGMLMLTLLHLLILGIEFLKLLEHSLLMNINHLIFLKSTSLLKLSAKELVELMKFVCSMDIYYLLLNTQQLHLIIWCILYHKNLDILKIETMTNV